MRDLTPSESREYVPEDRKEVVRPRRIPRLSQERLIWLAEARRCIRCGRGAALCKTANPTEVSCRYCGNVVVVPLAGQSWLRFTHRLNTQMNEIRKMEVQS
jgi:hypothetical protein